MQFNLLDYIIIAIIILSLLAGFKSGFIKAVTSIIGTVLAIFLAFTCHDEFLTFLNYSFNLQESLSEFILSKLLLNVVPVDVLFLADFLPIETRLAEWAEKFANYIMVILSFFIIFLISKLILRLLIYFLEAIFSFSFLSWLNRLLGMIIIPAKNLIVLIILLGITYPAIELAAEMGLSGALAFMSLIQDSIIADSLLNCFQLIKAWIIV